MEFKGTKGKWIKSKNAFNEDSVKSEFGFSVCKITGMDIQEMNYNHQLIIKAPEMLEMLIEIESKLGDFFHKEKDEIKQLIKEATEM